MPLSRQLLDTAGKRINDPRNCTEADLRRATSDIYYALFHRIYEAVIAPIGAQPGGQAFKEFLTTLYRLPDHSILEKRCKETLRRNRPG